MKTLTNFEVLSVMIEDNLLFDQVDGRLRMMKLKMASMWDWRRRQGTVTLYLPLKGKKRFLRRHKAVLEELGFLKGE